ncbi:hypothetical protein BRETT_003923 [Brettanomyces bruxellensis]|uniref:BZIP domain-containing protein n=1 Tax=Dekkera bruxellensis TaxID=5007 RepID=A0A871R211_DEKBR|nr:uncharacterized protein BRETT_003923 [Brettanomyces bruxellensis]QOU19769.1 hypothetical protein BRETT_003923 [Brettanomyces bruxellensis]
MATKRSTKPISPVVLSNGKIGTLPPRKRARTKEEKEQRRIERVLRNRRAAHASREKKRRHVEQLEKYAKQLETCLAAFSKANSQLLESQRQLVSKLQQANIDYSDVSLGVRSVKLVKRPENLDLDSSSKPLKRKKSKSDISTPKEELKTHSEAQSEEPESSPDSLSPLQDASPSGSRLVQEIPSPDFEEGDLMITKGSKDKSQQALKELELEQGILSPPPSTSPSKFKLNDDNIMKREFSNLFDDDVPMLNDEDYINNVFGGESMVANPEDRDLAGDKLPVDIVDQNEGVVPTSDMDYLDCLNEVHHSAVLMLLTVKRLLF